MPSSAPWAATRTKTASALGDGAYVDHLASEHSAYTGYTPLYLAVESGADGKIAKLLLDRGANVNTPVSVHRRRPS